ncbi:helix-turn-helix domain-containing protein [Sinimarinibacterium flocculans]|uniref:helix-turn-helix domain-containing protein n=1 Tax=Sinimarinibacterium flocculans TaxID=985250 RepID=UPI0035122870
MAAQLGRALRARRKALGISAAAAAEAAQVSRVTWHRLEKGAETVAWGSALAAARVLGLVLRFDEAAAGEDLSPQPKPSAWLPLRIRLDDFPQLRRLAWQVRDGAQSVSPREALGLYERNWRHMQPDLLAPEERALIEALRETFGVDGLRV